MEAPSSASAGADACTHLRRHQSVEYGGEGLHDAQRRAVAAEHRAARPDDAARRGDAGRRFPLARARRRCSGPPRGSAHWRSGVRCTRRSLNSRSASGRLPRPRSARHGPRSAGAGSALRAHTSGWPSTFSSTSRTQLRPAADVARLDGLQPGGALAQRLHLEALAERGDAPAQRAGAPSHSRSSARREEQVAGSSAAELVAQLARALLRGLQRLDEGRLARRRPRAR